MNDPIVVTCPKCEIDLFVYEPINGACDCGNSYWWDYHDREDADWYELCWQSDIEDLPWWSKNER